MPRSAAVVLNIGTDRPCGPARARPILRWLRGQQDRRASPRSAPTPGAPSACSTSIDATDMPVPPVDFNILQDCAPVFGPASRPLPQLPLRVRSDGYLIAAERFRRARRPRLLEPVGGLNMTQSLTGAAGTGRPGQRRGRAHEHGGRTFRAASGPTRAKARWTGRTTAWARRSGCARRWTRSSRTTGRSWSARSPCTAS